MFCKNCGNEINDEAVICPKCGRAVKEIAQGGGQTAPQELSQKEIDSVKYGVTLHIISTALTVVGFLVYVFLNYYVGLAITVIGFVLTIAFCFIYSKAEKALKQMSGYEELKKKLKIGRACMFTCAVIMILLGVSMGVLNGLGIKLSI